jgi:hypothetical protein
MRRGRELVALLETYRNPCGSWEPLPAKAVLARAADKHATATPAEGNTSLGQRSAPRIRKATHHRWTTAPTDAK